jgi:acetoin utilization deacetylase AcuC-like enzyme
MQPLAVFYAEGHEAHFEAYHPERPERLAAVRRAFIQLGLWEGALQVAPLAVSREVLQAVHSPAYLNNLEMVCRRGGHLDADTYSTPASWELALNSAGGAARVAQAVWQGEAQRGFALTRPPGHHACHGQGMGFCLINNIAVAAEQLVQKEGAQRIAIVDLDLHHGNGTQDIFWTRGDVFYLSTHQSPFYPGSGGLGEIGAGPGQGKTANFPLPPGSGDQAFLTLMDELILPLLERYQPEIVLVSYGFDPHWSDPLGQLALSAAGYGHLVGRLAAWADDHCEGRLALVLEGGYSLEAATECTRMVLSAMLDISTEDALGPSPYPESQAWRIMFERARRLWDT